MICSPSRSIALGVWLALGLATNAGADPLQDAAGRAGKDPRKLLELAELFVESQRLDEARRAFQKALESPSEKSRSLLGLAKVEMAGGYFKKAKRSCRALKRKDTSGLGEICEGELWMSADRTSRAMVEFRAAIGKGARALGNLGLAEGLRNQGRYREALEAYEEAASAGVGYRASIGKGLVLEAQKKKDEALEAFTRALRAQPASSTAHYNVGRLLQPGPKAVAQLQIANALRPNWSEGLLALGEALSATGEHAGALDVFQKAGNAGGAMGAASFGQARALGALGRRDEAQAALEKTIAAVPNHAEALLMLARIHMKKNEVNEALKTLEKARSAIPDEVSVYVATGEIYHRMGRDTAARSFLTHALTMNPNASRIHVILGDIACSRSLYSDGKKSYRAALAGDMGELTPSQIEHKIAACKRKEKN